MNKIFNKKFYSLLLAVAMLLCLAACGPTDEVSNQSGHIDYAATDRGASGTGDIGIDNRSA